MMLAIIFWIAGDHCKAATIAKAKANQAQCGACSAANGTDLTHCVADLQEAQHICRFSDNTPHVYDFTC